MKSLGIGFCIIGLLFWSNLFADGPPPARVAAVEVIEKEIEPTSSLVGVIDFDRISRVSVEVPGLITELHASEGARLAAGDPLLVLNTDFILKDIDIKRKQQAQLSADLEKVGNTLHRLKDLLKKNSASQQTYEDALYDHRSLQKKREMLDLELERLFISRDKSTVVAPFDGIVLEKLKERGEWIDPGSAICLLASTDDVIVKASLSENLLKYQTPGTPLRVSVTSLNLELEGRILTVSPTASVRSRSSLLKISIPFAPGMIQNMSALVDVKSGEKQRLLVVPRDALVRRNNNDFVYVVQDDQAKMLPVNVISRIGDMAGVSSSALKVKMRVVVDGNDRLRPDQAVTVVTR